MEFFHNLLYTIKLSNKENILSYRSLSLSLHELPKKELGTTSTHNEISLQQCEKYKY